jgi:hypothetical protein
LNTLVEVLEDKLFYYFHLLFLVYTAAEGTAAVGVKSAFGRLRGLFAVTAVNSGKFIFVFNHYILSNNFQCRSFIA